MILKFERINPKKAVGKANDKFYLKVGTTQMECFTR